MPGRYQQNPGISHWRAVKKVLRYLQRTKDYMLVYRRSDFLEISGFSDADFAGCRDSYKSTSGYIFKLDGGAVSWRSSKQSLQTCSTIEAEYVACFEATQHVVWLKNFITELSVVDSINQPIKNFCDHEGVVNCVKNDSTTTDTKYIMVKYLSVREKYKMRIIVVSHL